MRGFGRQRKALITSSADVDAVVDWATRAAAAFPWATWVPDPRDQVIVANVRPPLVFSMVLQYASLRAWLEGRRLTQQGVDAVAHELAAAWWYARMAGNFATVADVLRDIVLWNAVVRMSVPDRDAARAELARRREAAATAFAAPFQVQSRPPAAATPPGPSELPEPPPVKTTPRVADARKEAMAATSPRYTQMYEQMIRGWPGGTLMRPGGV
jgi:hypothetical protein